MGRSRTKKKTKFLSTHVSTGWIAALLVSIAWAGIRTYFTVQVLSSQLQTQSQLMETMTNRWDQAVKQLYTVQQAQEDARLDRVRMDREISKIRDKQGD